MKRRSLRFVGFLAVQAIVAVAFAASYSRMPAESNRKVQALITGTPANPPIKIERTEPLWIKPLYDDPEVVSDEELAAVLKQIRPIFPTKNRKPNYVEHALRTWKIDAEFQDPAAMSGIEMRDFLVDYGQYLASWGNKVEPLLLDGKAGVKIRWGHELGASVHHDHWLACLTEAGVHADQPVYTPTRRDMQIKDVVRQALYDFRYDEVETEWSAMAFGFWLPPTKSWKNSAGREMSFDMLAKRLLRGHSQFGVCGGTHRVYSLVVLIRLDDDFQILSKPVRKQVYTHLERVRDAITHSQFPDGRWPYSWPNGAEAITKPDTFPMYRSVISTGHHLEWLAIAPKDLHPPRELILKAADWIIKDTVSKSKKEIADSYTFYSHVGNALSLWRGTRAPDFWRKWQKTHPYVAEAEVSQAATTKANAKQPNGKPIK